MLNIGSTPALAQAQLVILGVIAMVIAQLVKLYLVKEKKATLDPRVTIIVVFVTSTILAVIWGGYNAVLSNSDPWQTVFAILGYAANVFAYAVVIYKMIMEKLAESAGWDQDTILKMLEEAAQIIVDTSKKTQNPQLPKGAA